MAALGVMQTADGVWRVEVNGVGSVTWYRLIGPDRVRHLPSVAALIAELADAGIDLAELAEVEPAA